MKYLLLLAITLAVGSVKPASAQYDVFVPTIPVSGARVVVSLEQPVNVKAILEKGWKDGKLPKNVVIRVAASLSGSKDGKDDLKEAWEFSTGQVHKVEYVRPTQTSKAGYQRLKSLPFDTKNLCEEIIEGDAFEIEAAEGDEEPAHFLGTQCDIGHRSITILIDGKREFHLIESCLFAGYPKPLAKKFAVLYEQLAQQARDEFKKE